MLEEASSIVLSYHKCRHLYAHDCDKGHLESYSLYYCIIYIHISSRIVVHIFHVSSDVLARLRFCVQKCVIPLFALKARSLQARYMYVYIYILLLQYPIWYSWRTLPFGLEAAVIFWERASAAAKRNLLLPARALMAFFFARSVFDFFSVATRCFLDSIYIYIYIYIYILNLFL